MRTRGLGERPETPAKTRCLPSGLRAVAVMLRYVPSSGGSQKPPEKGCAPPAKRLGEEVRRPPDSSEDPWPSPSPNGSTRRTPPVRGSRHAASFWLRVSSPRPPSRKRGG